MKKYLVLTSLVALAGCFSDSKPPRSIQVQGECLKKITPDKASVHLKVNNLKPNSQQAASETQRTYRDLALKLKEAGFELNTTQYNVAEDFSWDNKGVRKSNGWRAVMGIEVSTTDISKMSDAIVIATSFKNVESERFDTSISPELLKKEKDACLSLAVKDAESKAAVMLKSVEAKLDKVLLVSETYSQVTPIHPIYTRGIMAKAAFAAGGVMEDSADEAPSIETKAQDLKVGVNVTFEIK